MSPDEIKKLANDTAKLDGAEDNSHLAYLIERAITAAVAAEREAWLDAANVYMTETYGNGALGNPIDRARIAAIRNRVSSC